MTAQQAAEATAALVQLMPAEWRDGPGVDALEDLPTQCEAVLKQITRAVPLSMLLDSGPASLHHKCDRSMLEAADFFESTQVDELGAFVSHRWAADPRMTAQALTMATLMRNGWLCFMLGPTLLLLLLVILPLPVSYCLLPILPYAVVMTLDRRSSVSQWFFSRVLRFHKPWFWFDKVCVHQTEPCLNQAGIALFPHYLRKASQLWILFTPEYLTRVWCEAIPTQAHT